VSGPLRRAGPARTGSPSTLAVIGGYVEGMSERACLKIPRGGALVLLLTCAALSCTTGLQAQDNKASPAPAPAKKTATNAAPSNRFLFVVDTSSGMKKHAAETSKAVDSIIRNSASGQMRRGDTLGLWTFNTDLYTGLYPLQTWLPENLDEVALMTQEFLKQQKYGKACRFDLAMSGVMEIVKRSDIITVFVISTGEYRMQGTPFDAEINAQYLQLQKDNKGSHMPVVTVLQGKGGKLFRFTANMLPWPVVIPEVPIAVKMAAPASVQIAQTTATTPPPVVVAANGPQTLQPATVTPPVTTPPANIPPANAPQIITPATAPPQALPSREHANLLPRPPAAPLSALPGQPSAQQEPIAAAEPTAIPSMRQTPPAVASRPNPDPAPAQKPPVMTPPPAPVTAAVRTNAPTNQARGTNTSAAKPQTAAAIPGVDGGKAKIYLIAGAALLALAGLLIVRMVIRGRAYRPSLITNSLGGPPKR
jgi:hypothetical protein